LATQKKDSSSISAPPSTADAVAVALKQEGDLKQTPKVIAGGRGRVAEQILEVAFSHGIKVRADADLAQMLSVIDVDSEIPLEAFAIVAEVLTYVYEANNAMKPDQDAKSREQAASSADEMVASWTDTRGNEDD